jgi:hypothetical protein
VFRAYTDRIEATRKNLSQNDHLSGPDSQKASAEYGCELLPFQSASLARRYKKRQKVRNEKMKTYKGKNRDINKTRKRNKGKDERKQEKKN